MKKKAFINIRNWADYLVNNNIGKTKCPRKMLKLLWGNIATT